MSCSFFEFIIPLVNFNHILLSIIKIIDITTGIIVSHYVYMVASNNEQKINRFFTYLYVKILGYISKNPKETLKQDKEGSELSTFYRK